MAGRLAIIVLGMLLLTACGEPVLDGRAPTHEQYAEWLQETGATETLLGRAWLDAARTSLRSPTPVTLPFVEVGGFLAHEAAARSYSFEGLEGQKLRLELGRADESIEAAENGRVFVELFRAEERNANLRYARVAALADGEAVLETELPEDDTYIVRVQPELLAEVRYRFTLELEAVLPFPVSGIGRDAVQSFFGAERDAGARHHEGVDIFAPRSTPVLAVADGRAVPRQNRLGGNTVWLTVPGASYYYAHLERAAFDSARRVRAGDVIGYIGNSGNAATTPPHLHFGVYRWGRGAVDPLPLLGARHFEHELAPLAFAPRYGVTLASELNLRLGPSSSSARVDLLPAGSIVYATAASGDWLHVRPPGRTGGGWIHGDYERPLDDAVGFWRAPAPLFLRGSVATTAVAVDFVAAGTQLEVLREHNGHLLLRSTAARVGWARATADDS